MKTSSEIKKWLEYCHSSKPCIDCKYDQRDFPFCVRRLLADAINGYEKLESRLAQVERERDAAIHDMVQIVHEVDDNACVWCKNAYFDELKCKECRFYNEGFEWQGVQPTNTKEE